MQSPKKLLDGVHVGGPEPRDAEGKSLCGLSFASASSDNGCGAGKDVSSATIARRLGHVELTTFATVGLLYAIAVVSAWLLSLVVRVHADQFPHGALTPTQLTAVTLCLWSIALHLANVANVWPRCSRETAAALHAMAEVGAYVLLFFVCDRTTLLQRRPRVFNGDFFAFLVFAFVCASVATARRVRPAAVGDGDSPTRAAVLLPASATLEPPTATALLNRHHTEEYNGWAQLLFVLYGYFQNVHLYGMVRVCVSGFTFLTAFDAATRYDAEVSAQRAVVLLLRSLWRLNFLVVVTCALLRNQYMLYHICAVQSLVTVVVFIMMNVGPPLRSSRRVFVIKVGTAAVMGCALWDTPFSSDAFRLFWYPVQWLVRYDNPIVGVDPLHEWHYRTGLDHWIWLVGVVVAHRATFLNGLLRRLDGQRPACTVIKLVVAAVAVCVIGVFAYVATRTSRVDYNRYLPYISWAPILAFVTLRGLFKSVRGVYMPLCAFLGTFALEAYVAHNHVLMATTGVNGGPLYALRVLPGDHPLCDFGVFMLLMLWVSYRLSLATSQLQRFVLPCNASPCTAVENFALVVFAAACTYALHHMWCTRKD